MILSGWFISRGAVGTEDGHIAIFLPLKQLPPLIETDWDSDAMVHLTQDGGKAWGEDADGVCVCVGYK